MVCENSFRWTGLEIQISHQNCRNSWVKFSLKGNWYLQFNGKCGFFRNLIIPCCYFIPKVLTGKWRERIRKWNRMTYFLPTGWKKSYTIIWLWERSQKRTWTGKTSLNESLFSSAASSVKWLRRSVREAWKEQLFLQRNPLLRLNLPSPFKILILHISAIVK